MEQRQQATCPRACRWCRRARPPGPWWSGGGRRAAHARPPALLFVAVAAAAVLLSAPHGAWATDQPFFVFDSYPIPWSVVPGSGDAAGPKNLTASCICDLTAYVCDVNCCCDAACVEPVVSASTTANRCLPEGPRNQTLDWCIPNEAVTKTNLPGSSDLASVVVTALDHKYYDQLLCVVSTTDAADEYYPDPPAGNTNNNAADAGPCPYRPAIQTPGSYQFNTPVYVAFRRNATKEPLTLPYPAVTDDCSDQFQLGFLSSVPETAAGPFASCVRPLVDGAGSSVLQALCASPAASISKFANLAFYAAPGAVIPTPATLLAIERLNALTGTTSPLPVNSTATYWDGSTGTCHNMVVGVRMGVYYNWVDLGDTGMGSISAMVAVLTVANVRSSAQWVEQQVQVAWVQYRPNDNQVIIPYSGNPGYLTGLPVLAGASTTNPSNAKQVAISRLVQGMPMPAAADGGVCAGVAQQPVAYGYNATTNCAVPLTVSQLASFCANSTTDPALFLRTLLDGVWSSIAAGSLYLGVWGNSNASVTAEWAKVTVSGWPNAANLVARDRSCSNVVVGYDLQILTGISYASSNLQRMVLYANLCLRTANWTFPASQDADTPFPFMMTSTVSFIEKQQDDVTSATMPMPPLAKPVSAAIFYPFVTSAAPRTPQPCAPALLALALVATLLALCLRL